MPIPEASLRGIDGKFSFGPFCFDYNNRGKPRGIYPKEIENIRMIQKGQIVGANDHVSTFENFKMLMAAYS